MYYDKIVKSDDAEWVLFIHGLGGSMETWKYQLDDFKDYNILRVDLQGHGETKFTAKDSRNPLREAAEAIHNILTEEKIDKIHIVALSLGTIVALEYSSMYPDTVTSMTLAGCVVNLNAGCKILLSVAQFLKYILPVNIIYPIFAKIIMPFDNHKKSREIFVNEALKMTRKSFESWISTLAVTSKSLHSYIRNILKHHTPVLFVTGRQDYLFEPGIVKLSGKFNDFKLYLINKCGHVCSIEKKKEFNRVVLDFIKENGSRICPYKRRYIQIC